MFFISLDTSLSYNTMDIVEGFFNFGKSDRQAKFVITYLYL